MAPEIEWGSSNPTGITTTSGLNILRQFAQGTRNFIPTNLEGLTVGVALVCPPDADVLTRKIRRILDDATTQFQTS